MKSVISPYKKSFQGILIGIALFTLASTLLNFGSKSITALLCSVGWLFIIYNLFVIKGFYIPFYGTQKFLFKLYIFLVIIMIIRGYTIDYRYQWNNWMGAINYHLFSPFYILPYVLPLLILIGIQRFEFKTLAKLNILFNVLFVIFFALNIHSIYSAGAASLTGDVSDSNNGLAEQTIGFFIETGFFLLCKEFLSKNQWRFNLVVWVLATLTVAIAARRGQLLMMLLLGLSATILYIQSFKGPRKILSTVGVMIIASTLIGFYIYSENSLFAFLNDRGLEDTRSNVDEALLSQMDNLQLWFGKGLNGRYYKPLMLENDYLKGWRYGSETGFYNFVLKGGYVTTIVYILVLLIPALKGIFKSNNSFTKALGIYVFLSLIELYPFGWPFFDIKFLIIWIGVALCWNPVIRKMNNTEIKESFFSYD